MDSYREIKPLVCEKDKCDKKSHHIYSICRKCTSRCTFQYNEKDIRLSDCQLCDRDNTPCQGVHLCLKHEISCRNKWTVIKLTVLGFLLSLIR